MQMPDKKTIALFACFVSVLLFSGCTDWKKKYEALNVEHQNLKGLYDREKADKGQLAERISQDQQTIEDLQKQIEVQKKTPGQATGFGNYETELNAAAGTITVTLPDSILFDSGKADLRKATNADLDKILSVLQEKYAGKQIDIIGHTDSDPIRKSSWKDNLQLSTERANTVVRYLISHGIADEKIRSVGCGASRPKASNTSASGKARNRRVEIVIHMR